MASLLPGTDQGPLSVIEAEHIVQQLEQLAVQDVGSSKWHKQHEWIMRLNIQAHENTATHSDEFVMELLVSLDKMKVLVHDLLVIEAWKEQVLPHLKRHLAHKVNSTIWYLPMYHESVVANLLEVCLYHSHAVDALPEEMLLELADWCYRKLVLLNAPDTRKRTEFKDPKELADMDSEQELEQRLVDTDFCAAMCSLSIIRYLSDNITRVPMGLLSRMLSTNDTIMALVPLLDSPPWVRRTPKGKLEKFVGNTWTVVDPADRLKLTQMDAQVWLCLNNLLVEPRCRAKYGNDEWRRDRILTLKRFMNELLFDQLPVLKDLQRTLDEMALGVHPDAGASKSAALILEAVPVVRESLLRAVPDPRACALEQARTHFSEATTRQMVQQQAQAWMKSFELLAGLEQGAKETAAAAAGSGAGAGSAGKAAGPGRVQVSCWRKVAEGATTVMEPWCDFSMEVDGAAAAVPVSVGDLHGLRYKLLPTDPATMRPLPVVGKAVVRLGEPGSVQQRIAQALLQLPEVPVRSTAGEKPPIVWVNIGVLAEDEMVLQLKLKRADKPMERDKVSGVWYAYHPVGGALTVMKQEDGAQTGPPASGGKSRGGEGAGGTGSVSGGLIQTVGAPKKAEGGGKGGGSKAAASQETEAKASPVTPAPIPASEKEAAAAEGVDAMLPGAACITNRTEPSLTAPAEEPGIGHEDDLDLPD